MTTNTRAAHDGAASRPPRPWQRLSVRLAALFAVVTLVAVGAVGLVTYERHRREVEDTVGTQLLNIARVAALLVDGGRHAEVERTRDPASGAYRALRDRLQAIQDEVLLTSPIHTLGDLDPAGGRATLLVASAGGGRPGDAYPLAPALVEPLRWTVEDGVARYTAMYAAGGTSWITAFAPVAAGPDGRAVAVVKVDYPVEIYLDRLHELRATLAYASALGAGGTLLLGWLFARRLTRPIRALTSGVARVAAGDLSRALPVRSADELGRLTGAFNQMLEGLRQRDFIRSAFGRYVSPEVARELLDAPDGLRFGGAKRVVTVLMSDLRGYTRFAEQGDPVEVMEVLNGYLARMTDEVIRHGGTVNEFIGDAVFAVFGAPLAHADHAERAAACALAMQAAMAEINRDHAAAGLPRFEMGIGLNTGEAVVGNIGSEQRAKYAVVGSAVNVAARVEGATVGGQVFATAATRALLGDLAEVGEPVAVAVKGVAAPLVLYELRALAGRYAAPRVAAAEEPAAAVSLPLRCRVIEGKLVGAAQIGGRAVRLGAQQLDARLDVALAPLTNVTLQLVYPDGTASSDIYGKVTRVEPAPEGPLARIRFTSMAEADARLVESLAAVPAGA